MNRLVSSVESVESAPTGRQLWILSGQCSLVFTILLGFRAIYAVPKLLILIICAGLAGAILFGPMKNLGRVVITGPVVCMVSWWIASYFWTFNRFGWYSEFQRFVPMVVSCVVLASLLPLRQFGNGLLAGCYVAVGYTLYKIAANPSTTTVNPDGSPGWHGGFVHKNEMAPFMVFALLTFVSLDRPSWRRRFGVSAAILLIAMSHSTTSMASGLVVACVWIVVDRYGRSSGEARTSLVTGALALVVLAGGMYSSITPLFLNISGKDPTLTSRTEIWGRVIDAVKDHPWAGYGIGGVWHNPAVEPATSIMMNLGFNVFHAHNGFLEMLLVLGSVGLVLLLWLQLSSVAGALRCLRTYPAWSTYVISYVALSIMLSISEVATLGVWLVLLCSFNCLITRVEKYSDTVAVTRSGSVTSAGAVSSSPRV